MIIDVIKIGNSKGIRIPKNILKECGIDKKVELEIKGQDIHLKPVNPRVGWEEAFKNMRANNDDKLLIDDSIDLENEGDSWEW